MKLATFLMIASIYFWLVPEMKPYPADGQHEPEPSWNEGRGPEQVLHNGPKRW